MGENQLKAKISNFATVLPKYFIEQQDGIRWSANTHHQFLEKFPHVEKKTRTKQELYKIFDRFSCSPQKIRRRGVELPDMSESISAEEKMYSVGGAAGENSYGAHLGKKMDFFSKRSHEIFQELYSPREAAPDQIIHVTCTGYVSPSAPQQLVNQYGWQNTTGVTHAYHMGCYASLPAIRMADSMTISQGYRSDALCRVDVVHTEMCSLHMNPRTQSPEQIVIQSLFADGHIKYSINHQKPSAGRCFQIEAVSEYIIPDTAELMTWSPTFWGMDMTLSRKVPEAIQSYIKPFVEKLVEDSHLDLEDTLKNAIFAVHPGGPKIIDEIQKTLGLAEWQVKHSKGVLEDRGNMSSATLPHVWKSIIEDSSTENIQVVSLAFGPGLTVFGSVFSQLSQGISK